MSTNTREGPGLKTVNPMVLALDGLEADKGEVSNPAIQAQQTPKATRKNVLSLALGVVSLVAGAVLISLGVSGLISSEDESNASQLDRSQSTGTVFVHLFEWKWSDVEKECVEFLGPKGFSAVQVSPPNEHVDHKQVSSFPWWVRYQPVTYQLESRSGSREEFRSMVQTCKSVGVDIYVDAIINHMAALDVGSGTGVHGSAYKASNKQYPFFSSFDFNYCDPADIQGSDYANDAWRVRHCQLVGLPDLNQASEYVRQQQAAFLQDMVNLGVAGFRFDAGKHMEPADLKAIDAKVNGDFYVFLEVIDYGSDSISVDEYTDAFDVTEFRYEKTISNTFASGRVADLKGIGESFGFVSTLSGVVFVDNHDTQRHTNPPMTYRNGVVYDLATVFMLAWPYGYPKVMSSYAFNDGSFDQGPPSDSFGNTNSVHRSDGSVDCGNGNWVCEHRHRYIANMVAWKNYVHSVGAFGYENWWDNGFQAVAFSRVNSNSNSNEAAAFVIINKEDFSISREFYTALFDGVYCDVMSGDFENGVCSGNRVTVYNSGLVYVNIAAKSALAIYAGARLS